MLNCAWCGDEVAVGSHEQCAEALGILARKYEAAAQEAAWRAKSLLEDAAIVSASASIAAPSMSCRPHVTG